MAHLNFNASNVKPAKGEDLPNHSRQWSSYQEVIFNFVEHGQGNAIVEAVAGSGKSTTIVEALNRVNGSSVFLAFNKAIADELKARGVNARTFHSLTYSPTMRWKRQNNVTTDKLRAICRENLGADDMELYSSFAIRLVGLAQQLGIGCLVLDVEEVWMDIVIHHDLEPESEDADLGRGIEIARWLLDASYEDSRVNFDDMLYLTVRDNLTLPKFDFVFVDEAQDTNAIQREILKKIMHPRTRLIAVGDSAQAIYGFRGADSNSMNLIAQQFNCTKLPLSITYRCPTSVVKYARTIVNHIQARPNAPEGKVEGLGTKWEVKSFQPNDLVVCRTTKPLIALAFQMVRARVPVRIMGREIGQGLKNLITKMKARNLDDLENKLSNWRDKEVEKAVKKDNESKAEAIRDKVDAILCIIEGLSPDQEYEAGIVDLLNQIDNLFAEGVGKTVLATIHKAKGLEAEHVYWLNSSQCPSKWARAEWQKRQELNLMYVAITRAKSTLTLIEEK